MNDFPDILSRDFPHIQRNNAAAFHAVGKDRYPVKRMVIQILMLKGLDVFIGAGHKEDRCLVTPDLNGVDAFESHAMVFSLIRSAMSENTGWRNTARIGNDSLNSFSMPVIRRMAVNEDPPASKKCVPRSVMDVLRVVSQMVFNRFS